MNIRDLASRIKSGNRDEWGEFEIMFPTMIELAKRNGYGFKLFNSYICGQEFFINFNKDMLDYYSKQSNVFIDGKLNYRNGNVKRLVRRSLSIYIGNRIVEKGERPLFMTAELTDDHILRVNGFETCMFDEIDNRRFTDCKCFGRPKNIKYVYFVSDILGKLKEIEQHTRDNLRKL